jgi:hypothetical protein
MKQKISWYCPCVGAHLVPEWLTGISNKLETWAIVIFGQKINFRCDMSKILAQHQVNYINVGHL